MISSNCHPPGMRPDDPPAKQAYDWGEFDRRTDEDAQPDEFPSFEKDYWRGWNGERRLRRHRRPWFRKAAGRPRKGA